MSNAYTSTLNAGVGMLEESRILLDLWQPGMSATDLNQVARESGQFPNQTARRLRNLVFECFKTRYMVNEGAPAILLKAIKEHLSSQELKQLLFLYTCRSQLVLADFVNQVYWNAYASGRDAIRNEEVQNFLIRANQDGKTSQPWSENTIQRVARYLTATCADFGLLEGGTKSSRRILAFRIEPRVAVILAYDLHFSGLGDNLVIGHTDWALFGLERADVLEELKRLALQGHFIVQSAGGVTRIGWQYHSMEELVDALTR